MCKEGKVFARALRFLTSEEWIDAEPSVELIVSLAAELDTRSLEEVVERLQKLLGERRI
jgi:hypothetical protein